MQKIIDKILNNSEKLCKRSFKKGETVVEGGMLGKRERTLGYVSEGEIKAKNVVGGKNVPMQVFRTGDLFGAAILFADNDEYCSEFVAQKDSEIIFVPENILCDFITEDSGFALEYTKFLTKKLQLLNRKISGYTSKTANDKLLLYLDEKNGYLENLDMSLLAKTLGIGRASLYRAIDELIDKKLIVKKGKDIIKL